MSLDTGLLASQTDQQLYQQLKGVAGTVPAQSDPGLKQRIESAIDERERIENDGLTDYYTLRKGWSKYIMWALGISAVFQAGLVTWVGAGWLEFSGHEVFLNTVAAEIFLQIAGMGYIIVKCLFPHNRKKKPPKND